jgi:hypothetical protein
MTTLFKETIEVYVYQCDKHDLAPDSYEYAESVINGMSQWEFLHAISMVLDTISAEKTSGVEADDPRR